MNEQTPDIAAVIEALGGNWFSNTVRTMTADRLADKVRSLAGAGVVALLGETDEGRTMLTFTDEEGDIFGRFFKF